ncbi:basic amino acid ABC transporter substrate-binding protein [Anaerovorax odorimutans]|uniref:basic amino acid ABC transporter substrate-binding protein n=1 Tax=Anaerovorax odorimutans TaxID=109327 RepID=UPI00042812D0|nr:basic amino acid ABC transporter substrate-binding protein [Anaerovorax odorimutans]
MKNKKILVLLLVLAMVFSFAACGESADNGDADKDNGAADKNTEIPTYIAATEPTFPPFDTTDEDGNIVGFDMDLMNAIGEDQGFKVKYKAFEFDALIPTVQAGNAEIITAGMNAEDPERQAKVDFSNTYYDSGLVVIVKEDNNTIKGIDDLTKDMKVASQIGTTGADKVNELHDDGKIKEAVILNGFDTCMLQLINGDVSAVIIDQPVGKTYLKKQPGKCKIVGDVLNAESYGFAVKKGNKELLDKINTGLQNMIDNGTYDELFTKWFEGEE